MKTFKEFENQFINEVTSKDEKNLYNQLEEALNAAGVIQANIQQMRLDLQFFRTNKEDIIENVDWIIKEIPNLKGEMLKLKKLVKKTKQ